MGKVLPTTLQYATSGFLHKQFTKTERAQIALGYPILIEVHMVTQHKPGKMVPIVSIHTTNQEDPKPAIDDLMKDRLAKAQDAILRANRQEAERARLAP